MAAKPARKPPAEPNPALKSYFKARKNVHPAHARPLNEDPYAVYLMQLGAESLEVGNRNKKLRVEQRRKRIAEIYIEHAQQPIYAKNKDKLHNLIIAKLEAENFHLGSNGKPSGKSGVTVETLVNSDLPALRKKKLIR